MRGLPSTFTVYMPSPDAEMICGGGGGERRGRERRGDVGVRRYGV